MGNEASAERLSDDSVSVQDDTSGRGKKMPNMVLIFERWIDAKPKYSLPTSRTCAPLCIVYLDGREIGKAVSYPSEPISLLPRTPNSVLHFRFFEQDEDEASSSSSTCLGTKDCKSSSNEDNRELTDEPKSPPVAVVALDSNPDGVVDAEDPTEESNALDTLNSEGEEDIPPLVQLRIPVSKFVMFGAPLYSSMCLGLPIIEGSQEPLDLNDAVLHSSNWEVPKICMSLFKPNRTTRKADAMPQPDIHAALAEEGGGGFCAAPIEHAVPPEVQVKGLINSSMSNALRMQDWGEMVLKMESEMQALKADAVTKEEELKLQVTDTQRQLEALKKADHGRLRMEKEYQESEARFQQLSADHLSTEHERARLQALLDNIENTDKAIVMDADEKERSAQEIDRLQVQCNELLGEVAEQKRALEAFELQQQDTREIQVGELIAPSDQHDKEIGAHRVEMKATSDELENLRAAMDALSTEAQAERSAQEAAYATAMDQIQALQGRTSHQTELEGELASSSDRIRNLNEELSETSQQILALQNAEATRQEQLESELGQQLKEAELALTSEQARAQQLQSAMNKQRGLEIELARSADDLETLQAYIGFQKEVLDSESMHKQRDLAHAATHRSKLGQELETAVLQQRDLETKLTAATESQEALQANSSNQQEENTRMLEQATAHQRELEETLAEALSHAQELSLMAEHQQQNLDEQLKAESAQVLQLQTQTSSKEELLSALQKTHADSLQELKELQANYTQLQAKVELDAKMEAIRQATEADRVAMDKRMHALEQAYQTAAAENHAIKELHQEKESLQQEIFALQRELDQVRYNAAEESKLITDLREEKEKQCVEVTFVHQEMEQARRNEAEQKQTISTLLEQKEQTEKELLDIRAELNQAMHKSEVDKEKLSQLLELKETQDHDLANIREELEQVMAKAKAGDEALQQLNEVKEKQEQELNALKGDIENAHQNIQEQNQKLQSLYDHEEQHKKEMDTITRDFNQANDRGLQASESLKTLALEKDQKHEELSSLHKEHEQVKKDLTAQLTEATEVIKKLTVERDAHANQQALLTETILELEKTLAGQASLLQTRITDANSMGSKAVAQLQHALTQANENVATLSQERDAAKMEARAYQGQVDALHTSIQREKKQLEEHAQTVLHQVTSKMQSNIDALIEEKSGLEKQLTQTSATSQGSSDMQATLDALRAEKCELERKLQEGTNDSKTLALLAENGDLHQQLAQAKAAEDAVKQEMTNLRNDNDLRKEERTSLLAEKRALEKEFLELQDSSRSKQPPPAQLAPQAPDTSLREAPDMIILKVFRRLIFEKFSSKNADELSRLLKMEGPSTSMRKADVDKVLKQYKKFKDEFDERKAFQKMDAHKAGSIPAAVFQDVLAKLLYLDSQASDYIYAIIDGVLHGSHPLKRTQFSGVQFASQQAGEIEQENFVRLLSDPCMR